MWLVICCDALKVRGERSSLGSGVELTAQVCQWWRNSQCWTLRAWNILGHSGPGAILSHVTFNSWHLPLELCSTEGLYANVHSQSICYIQRFRKTLLPKFKLYIQLFCYCLPQAVLLCGLMAVGTPLTPVVLSFVSYLPPKGMLELAITAW